MKELASFIAFFLMILFLLAIFGDNGLRISINNKVYQFKIGTKQ